MRQGDYGSAKFFYRKGLRYYGLSAKMGVPAPQLQMALNQRGFNVGEPDGVLGPRTRAALIQFQQREGLQRTGQIDQQHLASTRADSRARPAPLRWG
jgi:Putative peptidoglycan binding domain